MQQNEFCNILHKKSTDSNKIFVYINHLKPTVSYMYITCRDIKRQCIFPTQYLYVRCMILTVNTGLVSKRRWLIGLSMGDELCFQWYFIYNLNVHPFQFTQSPTLKAVFLQWIISCFKHLENQESYCETVGMWNFLKAVRLIFVFEIVLTVDFLLCRFHHVHNMRDLASFCATILRNGQPCTTANY